MCITRFSMACSLAVLLACASGHNPVSTVVSTDANLPVWMFAHNGQLIRPADGIYGVFYGIGVGSDPEVATHIDRVLASANDLTGGSIRFVRSMGNTSPLSIEIDPSSPYATDHLGWGILILTDHTITRDPIGLQSRSVALSNVPLHEIGHFLFGPGHSDDPVDLMSVFRISPDRLSFSSNEYAYWRLAKQYPPGTRLNGATGDEPDVAAQSVGARQIFVE